MFNGQNTLPGFPEDLTKVVNFLNEKAAHDEFTFSNSLSYWADHELIVDPLGLGINGDCLFFAVSLAYLANLNEGHIAFPEEINEWRWAWSLNLLAEYAEWPSTYMKSVMASFPCRSDGVENLMHNAAHTYGWKNYDNGLELMKLLPQYQDYIKAGLMENDFERYCTDFPPQDNNEEYANIFAQTFRIKEECFGKAFDITLGFPSFTSAAAMGFYLTIHSHLGNEKETVCENKIRELLEKGNTAKYVSPVTNWAFRLRRHLPFMEECILLLIKGLGKEDNSLLDAIDNAIAYKHDNVEFLTKLIICVAEHLEPTDVWKMKRCIHNLSKKQDIFLDLVLSFIIHPKGMFRLTGRRLWDDHHLEHFDFSAADLEEPLQCFFIISMLQDFGNPETRLPKVLPLLSTESTIVKKLLMSCLRPYVDEYMGHVISALEKLQIDGDEAMTIKKYVDDRANIINERREIKELSPSFIHDDVFREALRQQHEHMKEKMKEAESEHKPAWLNLMAQVVLARSGGWRETDGTYRHLPLTTFSIPSHMMLESMSPKEQKEWINLLFKDWNDTTRDN